MELTAYMLRRQRKATIETDAKLAAYVTDRLTEGWTPEQVAGRLRLGIEPGLRAVCAETIYGWIYRAGQKAERLWRFLVRHHAVEGSAPAGPPRTRSSRKPTFLSDLTPLTRARL